MTMDEARKAVRDILGPEPVRISGKFCIGQRSPSVGRYEKCGIRSLPAARKLARQLADIDRNPRDIVRVAGDGNDRWIVEEVRPKGWD